MARPGFPSLLAPQAFFEQDMYAHTSTLDPVCVLPLCVHMNQDILELLYAQPAETKTCPLPAPS